MGFRGRAFSQYLLPAICAGALLIMGHACLAQQNYADTPDADPSITHNVDVFVPTHFFLIRTPTHISAYADTTSLKTVSVAVGKNMSLGMKIKHFVYRADAHRPAETSDDRPFEGMYFGIGTAKINLDAISSDRMDMDSSRGGIPQDGVKYIIGETVIIFQTASPPQHGWMPEGSKYKVLWNETHQQICVASGVSHSEGVPEVRSTDKLHQLLVTAHNRSLLIADGAPAFHMVAQIELSNLRNRFAPVSVTLDEVWRDPLHWKLTTTYGNDSMVEVVNGNTAYTTGAIPKQFCCQSQAPKWVSDFYDKNPLPQILREFEAALANPIVPSLLNSDKLTPSRSPCLAQADKIISCSCIIAEPELSASQPPLATTSFCIDPTTSDLRHAIYPDDLGYSVDLYDQEPFGDKQIAHTIDLNVAGSLIWRMHVIKLENAIDFTALSQPVPPHALIVEGHTQEDLLADDLMRGQQLPGGWDDVAPKLKHRPGINMVTLLLKVDTAGSISGYTVLEDRKFQMTPTAAEALKQCRYRASYQGDHVVPADQEWTFWPDGSP